MTRSALAARTIPKVSDACRDKGGDVPCTLPVALRPPYPCGMVDNPTIGELLKAKMIAEADVTLAVHTYMDDPNTGVLSIGNGYQIDVAEAVRSSKFASHMMEQPDSTPLGRRDAIRTAILRARPEKR
jgi:hypothetical protein